MTFDQFSRICDAQQDAIEQRFGKDAALNANYGWGQGTVFVETKVYAGGNAVIVSHEEGGVVKHRWSH